jgi:hypothetical protein
VSHRWDCPTDYEARRQGERAQERGEGRWRNPHGDTWRDGTGCEEAERAWDRGHRDAERREEERAEDARVERRHAEMRHQHAVEEQWAYEGQQESQQEQEYRQYCDGEYARMEAEHFADLYENHLIETRDIPRWEDDGGRII